MGRVAPEFMQEPAGRASVFLASCCKRSASAASLQMEDS